MTERAFVTGATGFLGSVLCRKLVEEGWNVGALRRESSDVSHLSDLDIEWYVGDVCDPSSLIGPLEAHDRIFHLAGIGLTSAAAETVYQVNVEGTRNVLSGCAEGDVERVVFTSTAGTRRSDGSATERDRATPIGAYQQSKARAERLVTEYVDRSGDAVIVHPTSVFGPGDEQFTARLLTLATNPAMVAYLPGGASFVSPTDVCRGIVDAMENGKPGEHYILGGENLDYGDALRTISDAAGGRAPAIRVPPAVIHAAGPVVGAVNERFGTRLFPFDAEMAKLSTRRLFYSSTKAERELGYAFDPFETLIGPSLDWYARRQ